jgi:hypothetical protein
MSDRLARQRWWISCLYGLAVVLAQGLHTHHAPRGVGDPFASAGACGEDHGEPVSGEDRGGGPAFSPLGSDCPSCDFLLSHQAPLADRDDDPEAARFAHLSRSTPADPDTAPVRPRSRAPPLA